MKTPIEKAVEAVVQRITCTGAYRGALAASEPITQCVAIARRVLSEEVPEKNRTHGKGMQSTLDSIAAKSYNQARRDIGLED